MSKGVILIHFCVLLCAVAVVVVEGETVGAAVAAAGAEEHVERVGAPEERGKGGVRVAMESVVMRRAARSARRAAASCLQTCNRTEG